MCRRGTRALGWISWPAKGACYSATSKKGVSSRGRGTWPERDDDGNTNEKRVCTKPFKVQKCELQGWNREIWTKREKRRSAVCRGGHELNASLSKIAGQQRHFYIMIIKNRFKYFFSTYFCNVYCEGSLF